MGGHKGKEEGEISSCSPCLKGLRNSNRYWCTKLNPQPPTPLVQLYVVKVYF